jgi:hypothetical protein
VWQKTYSGLEEIMKKSEKIEPKRKGMSISCIDTRERSIP